MAETKNGEGDFIVDPEQITQEIMLGITIIALTNLRVSDEVLERQGFDLFDHQMRYFNIAPVRGRPDMVIQNHVFILTDKLYYNDQGPRRMSLVLQLKGEDSDAELLRLYNMDFDNAMYLKEVRQVDIDPILLERQDIDLADELVRVKNSFGEEIEEGGAVCDYSDLASLKLLLFNLRPCLPPPDVMDC